MSPVRDDLGGLGGITSLGDLVRVAARIAASRPPTGQLNRQFITAPASNASTSPASSLSARTIRS